MPENMPEDALIAVTMRNNFYRDGQRKMMVILLLSIIGNMILAAMLAYIITHPLRQNILQPVSMVALHHSLH